MDLYGIGFSDIRMSDSKNDYTYKYDYRINIFPEEVYLHEFLHTLERTMNEYNHPVIELHASSQYNYNEEKLVGLKSWYKDYMNCEVKDSNLGKNVGLESFVYSAKPAHNSDFNYSVEVEFNNESNNLLQDIKSIFDVIGDLFKNKGLDENNIRTKINS